MKEFVKEKLNLINNGLDKYLTPTEPKEISEAMRYSTLGGGKRLRPMLILSVCQMFGGNINTALPFACALEMIHCYSLIHDDLPAMDDDDLRRGKPTNHKIFGEAMAILAGDGLLNTAFEIMANACVNDNNKNTTTKAMAKIATCAGTTGMIGGQVRDILWVNKRITQEELIQIHHNKTAKLFIAAFTAGAILADADDDTIKRMELIGEKFGLAFQIHNDLQDIFGTEEKVGKKIGGDADNNKHTYPSIFGLDETKKRLKELKQDVFNLLSKEKNSDLLIGYLNNLLD